MVENIIANTKPTKAFRLKSEGFRIGGWKNTKGEHEESEIHYEALYTFPIDAVSFRPGSHWGRWSNK
jgi:hypothetical protein